MTKLQFHGRSIIITLLVMLLTVAMGGYAQNASATASVDFDLTTAGNQTQTSLSGAFAANQIIKLEVRASGTSAIIAHQFRLSFDSTYFAFVSGSSSIDNGVVEENRLKNNGGSIFLNTFTSAVSTSGTTSTLLFGVTLDGASQTQAMSVSGEGLMGVVALRVKAAFVANPNTSTNLTLVNAKFVHYTNVSNENALGTTYSITHTIPTAPVLQSPATGATNQATTLTLTWGSVTGATSYRLQLATDSLFANLVVNDSTLTSASRQVGPLLNNTKYFWRVNAKNAAGTSGYSSVFNFTTIVAVPGIPVLQSPATGATNQATTLTLTWGSVTGAASYRLQLATDSLFANLVVNDSTLTSASRQVGPLLNNTKYYWRVNAKNAAGTSSYSSVFNFTTIVAVPGIPVLQSPATGATNQATTLTLSWGSVTGATSYRLQLATDSLFANLVVNDSTLTSASRQVGPLLNNTKYFWRVNAKNAAGTSGYSSVFNFTTIVAVPGIPVLLTPASGSIDLDTTLTLTWGSVTGAATYRLQVTKDSLFATLVFNDSTITSASKQVALASNTKFYWRVSAKNAAGTSAYSTIFNFRTKIVLAVDEKNNPLPTSYTLLQNYPNPFNPTTNITFGVPENSSVKIVIYDIIGREVATLVNENYTPGYYTMPFNATTLTSGMYIYRMTSQSLNGDQKLFTNTKKFMLLK